MNPNHVCESYFIPSLASSPCIEIIYRYPAGTKQFPGNNCPVLPRDSNHLYTEFRKSADPNITPTTSLNHLVFVLFLLRLCDDNYYTHNNF